MIRPIDIRLNAAHPELPLAEATTYTGAPSTVLIRGVPANCGKWAITAVSVAATYPDNTTTTRAAVQSANGVWVATIPATETSGRTACGLRVMADGIDENGDAVTGYILGVADFAVCVLGVAPAPAPGGTSYAMSYFEAAPNPAKKGDVAKIGGVFKLYTGEAWEALGGDISGVVRYDTAQTLTEAQAAQARANIKATLAARGEPSTPGFSAWTCTSMPEGITNLGFTISKPEGAQGYWWELLCFGIWGGIDFESSAQAVEGTATSATFSSVIGPWGDGAFSFNRTALPGYQLGSQTDKPIASEAEAAALRESVAGKYTKPSVGIPKTDLASGVQSSLDKADSALPTTGGTMTGNIAWEKFTLQAVGDAGFIYYQNGQIVPAHSVSFQLDGSLLKGGELALTGDIPYSLVPTRTESGQLTDRASNKIYQNGATDIVLTFPAAVTDKARDFVVYIVKGSNATGAVTFSLPTGASIRGSSLTQTIAAGEECVFGITEIAQDVFLVKAEKVEVPA